MTEIFWLVVYADAILTVGALVTVVALVAEARKAPPQHPSYNEILDARMETARWIAKNLEGPLAVAVEDAVNRALRPQKPWRNDTDCD